MESRKTISVKLIAALLFSLLAFAGCSQKKQEDNSLSFAQNDWAGAFKRLAKVQADVMKVTSVLDTHNYAIIEGNPDDYWANDEFRYLHFVPMDSSLLPYTAYLNEVEDFSVVQANITSAFEETEYQLASIDKIAPHHYNMEITMHDLSWRSFEEVYKRKTVECIYDASHDWLQMSTAVKEDFFKEKYEEDLYEFAEMSAGEYAFQNEKERMYVLYNEDGSIKEFYYSILPDVTKTIAEEYYRIEEEEQLRIEEAYGVEHNLDELVPGPETGKVGLYYTKEGNSIFHDLSKCGKDWVFQAEKLKTRISYSNHTLSVSVLNKLTGQEESFVIEESTDAGEEGGVAVKEDVNETVQGT